MKKTVDISLGGMRFHVEEDAYARLDAYLASIRAHFGTYAEHDEIVADIEARIAERLSAKKSDIVTIVDIDEVVAVMGKVEDFEGAGSASTEPKNETTRADKRLFRDPDDKVIAGVASGLAAYFNVDPTFMRVLFVILGVVTGGTAILIYLILALIVPEAKTPAEKLQMRGGPIDLKSFEREVKKSVETIRRADFWGKIRDLLANFFRAIGNIFRWALKLILSVVGACLALGATLLFAIVTFMLGNFLFNAKSSLIHFPLAEMLSGGAYRAIVLFGYALVIVPIVALFLIALSALRRAWVVGATAFFALFASWLLCAAAAGVMAVRIAPAYEAHVRTLPDYRQETRAVPVDAFAALKASGHGRIRFVATDSATGVTVTGAKNALDRLSIAVQNGELLIRPTESKRPCLFCPGFDAPEIEIRAPRLERAVLTEAVRLEGTVSATTTFHVTVEDATRAELTYVGPMLSARMNGIGRLVLTGKAQKLEAMLEDAARLEAYGLEAAEARIVASDASRAETTAASTLDARAIDAARIRYRGAPELKRSVSDIGSVHADGEPTEGDTTN